MPMVRVRATTAANKAAAEMDILPESFQDRRRMALLFPDFVAPGFGHEVALKQGRPKGGFEDRSLAVAAQYRFCGLFQAERHDVGFGKLFVAERTLGPHPPPLRAPSPPECGLKCEERDERHGLG